jgi:uncharacterized membrane protein YjjB (DUF3815 family)
MNFSNLLHNAICGGLAAAGSGVLFNIGFPKLLWCAASGVLALTLRTIPLGSGLSTEAASFVAASTVGIAVWLLPSRAGVSHNTLHVVGCIPMIPGAFAAKALLGLFAITADKPGSETLITAMDNTLRVIFTMGAPS